MAKSKLNMTGAPELNGVTGPVMAGSSSKKSATKKKKTKKTTKKK